MEYAISILAVAIFATLYLVLHKKQGAVYFEEKDDESYALGAKVLAESLPMPKNGASIEAKAYVWKIKWLLFRLKFKRNADFANLILPHKEKIDFLLKKDFSSLEKLPSVNRFESEIAKDKEPRAVAIARYCLAYSDYKVREDRIRLLLDEQNKKHTLSFSEIMEMKNCFLYVLLEALALFSDEVGVAIKVRRLAMKYAKNNVGYEKKCAGFSKSKLFLSYCAEGVGYETDALEDVKRDFEGELEEFLSRILIATDDLREYDFSRFYVPLEILDKFENFANAGQDEKYNFLSVVKEVSDKENIDEFMFVIRLEKYMQSASSGHIFVRRASLFGRNFCILSVKKSIAMLAAALSSRQFMKLFFENNKFKKQRSIPKIFGFENTFEPIYKFNNINFGISTYGGKLRVSPTLPNQIESADIVFTSGGVQNKLHIERGKEKEICIGDTHISGLESVKLGSNPMDITVIIPEKRQ